MIRSAKSVEQPAGLIVCERVFDDEQQINVAPAGNEVARDKRAVEDHGERTGLGQDVPLHVREPLREGHRVFSDQRSPHSDRLGNPTGMMLGPASLARPDPRPPFIHRLLALLALLLRDNPRTLPGLLARAPSDLEAIALG